MLFSLNDKLYFVFAHEQDVFFTDSLLRLGVHDYLWLMLRKSGYRHIFFVMENPGGFTVRIPDSDSAKLLRMYSEKRTPSFQAAVSMNAADLCNWISGRTKRGTSSGPAAWVIPGTAMQKCAHSLPGMFADVIDSRGPGADTVILQFPMQMSARELSLFTSENSFFAKKTGRGSCLSKPVYDMIHIKDSVSIFKRLKADLGSSLIQLSAVSFEQLRSMLRWAASRLELEITVEQLHEYTNFLYWYVYSPTLRAVVKGPFSSFSTYRELSDYLLRPDTFTAIRERVNKLKGLVPSGNLVDILNRLCPLEKNEDRVYVQISHSNGILRRLSDLPYPVDFNRGPDAAYLYWMNMQRQVRMPNTCPIPEKRLNWISVFMDFFEEARRNQDMETTRRAAEALRDTARNLYLPMGSESRMKAHQLCLELSRSIGTVRSKCAGEAGTWIDEQLLEEYGQMLRNLEKALANPSIQDAMLLHQASTLLAKTAPAENWEHEQHELSQEEQEAIVKKYENLAFSSYK